MLERVGKRFERFFRSTTPDPFVLAIGLTLVVFVLAFAFEGSTPEQLLQAWQGDLGFWSLLGFSMQMLLMLVTGHALAATPPVQRAIGRLAALPRTGGEAAALVAFISISCALLNWGLGLIVGALLARDVGAQCRRKSVPVSYPLLVAAGYSGLMCWHGGLSGTAPLKMTTAADAERFLGPDVAAAVGVVPFTRTVLGTSNLVITGGLLLLLPALCYFLAPKSVARPDTSSPEGVPPGPIRSAHSSEATDARDATWLERIEQTRLATTLIALPLFGAIYLFFRDAGVGALDPNAINLIFLTAGLLLHGTIGRYGKAVETAMAGATGIVLQFPFYAGIMGVMRTTGLATDASAWLLAHSPVQLYTTITLFSAACLNLLVPSGGGQWAVQGPIVLEAAAAMGLAPERVIMAVAYGDQLSNMLQPFWALPLLAITKVRARDIIGYTSLFMLAGGTWMMFCLLVEGQL